MPLIVAPADARDAIRRRCELNDYSISKDGLQFLAKHGVDRFAAVRAAIRHVGLGRKLYLKWSDDGSRILERQFHGEVALFEDDSLIAYLHFTFFGAPYVDLVVRAHQNNFPNSLPWN